TFALVGKIRPSKGQESAIRALALVAERFPGTRLILVGGGDIADVERCEAVASQLGIRDHVEFRGYIANPWPVYLEADAVLMCSINEAMGRVTAEAMAACRPVIGLGRAGTVELVEHERTGLLYRGGPEALAASMVRV